MARDGLYTIIQKPNLGVNLEVVEGYSLYLEVLMSEMSTGEIAKLLEMSEEEIERMELELLNAWVYEDTGEYFDDIPKGPEWLQSLICVRTDALSRRMLNIWNKTLTRKLRERDA